MYYIIIYICMYSICRCIISTHMYTVAIKEIFAWFSGHLSIVLFLIFFFAFQFFLMLLLLFCPILLLFLTNTRYTLTTIPSSSDLYTTFGYILNCKILKRIIYVCALRFRCYIEIEVRITLYLGQLIRF